VAIVAVSSHEHVERFRAEGFAVARGLFDRATMAEVAAEAKLVHTAGMAHHTTWRHRNLLFEILPEDHGGRRHLLQAHWFAWISPFFERFRRDPRWFQLLEPLLGRDIRQIAQQIHWKPPGAELTGYRYHQDMRFRDPTAGPELVDATVTVGLAIDPATTANGCLMVAPGSHRLGYLGLSDDGPLMKGETGEDELRRAGVDPGALHAVELAPGDVVLWGLLTVHGSAANRSDRDRAFAISSYVRADATDRGEWAFRDGEPVPLGPEPNLCKYADLHVRPGPFHIDDPWYRD
jgi:hypothetical protein